MSDNPRFTAVVLLILLSLIWGTSFILIKHGLKVFAPDEVGALRVSAASLFMLPIALIQIRGLRRDHYLKLFASGMFGVFIPGFLFAFAQTRIESSVTGIVNTLTPLATMIVGVAFFRQRFMNNAIAGVLLGLAGTIVLVISSTDGAITINAFAFLIVLACLTYGINLNLIKSYITDLPALSITSVSLLLIGPLALIYLFGISDFTSRFATNESAWKACGLIVLLGLMSTAVAMFIFNRLVKISTPLFASSVTYIMPIVSVMWGVLDGEKLYVSHYIGMITILAGVYWANRRR